MRFFCINGVNVPLFYYSLYDLFANPSFSNCNNAGFRLQQKSIFKIHYQEMMLFIILIVIFPIVMYGSLLYQSYLVNMITYNTFITMIAIYIILYTFMSIYMIVSYRKLIKEVYDDVRYLNHGE